MKLSESKNTRPTIGSNSAVLAAFTLIELLVSIAIIAILIAIILPAISSTKEHGQRAACVANIRALLTVTLQEATLKNGFFPDLHHSGLNYPYWFDEVNMESFRATYGLAKDTFYSPSNPDWSAEAYWDYSPGARVAGYLYMANDNNWAASATVIGADDTVSEDLSLFAKRLVDETAFQHLWVDLTRELSSGWGAGVNHQESGVPTGTHAGFRDGHVEWVPWEEIDGRNLQVGGVKMRF